MLNRSARFDSAIVNGHRVIFRAEVYNGLSGNLVATLNPIDGDVQGDLSNAIRRSCSLRLTDPTGLLVPENAFDQLTPYGNELRVYRGIVYGPGDVELIPLGVFGIAEVEIESGRGNSGTLGIRLIGYDRADRVSRAKLVDDYTIVAGTNVGTAIQSLIASRVPGLTYAFSPVTSTLPLTTFHVGDDPWTKCLEMAQSAGLDLYFDAYGTCTLAPIPDPNTAPVVWIYNAGSKSTLLRVNRKLTNRNTFNDVVVIAEGTGIASPVRVEVADTDPNSATYVNGPYGKVVTTYRSPLITSQQQAIYAAQGILARSLGEVESIEFDGITHPAHEPGDVVQIVHLPTKTKTTHVMHAVTHPVHHARSSTHRTRKRRG